MKITFDAGGRAAEFHRNSFTGRAWLIVDGEERVLASPWRLSTQYSFKSTRKWNISHAGHEIEIEKRRPRFFAGFRPQSFTIRVDGQQVASAQGM